MESWAVGLKSAGKDLNMQLEDLNPGISASNHFSGKERLPASSYNSNNSKLQRKIIILNRQGIMQCTGFKIYSQNDDFFPRKRVKLVRG